MFALRAPVAFDGTRFLDGGATVLVEDETIVGVEARGFPLPEGCQETTYDGTLLPGLVDAHVHLVADGSFGSLERAGEIDLEAVDAQIARSLAAQAARGVTTVRDLGDRDYRTLAARDRRTPGEPRVVAAGPPVTVPGGHCHYLGGSAAPEDLRVAAAERHERGVDVVKVMASGGFLTEGTDMFGAQYAAAELRDLVEAAHDRGLPVTAHAHSIVGIEAALAAGVDGIEHFSGITENGVALSDDLLDRVAAAGIVVDPTMGFDLSLLDQMPPQPPQAARTLARMGTDMMTMMIEHAIAVGRLREHGIRVVPGVDSGAMPLKPHGNAWIAVLDLVKCGWSLDEALAAGTSGAAEACGVDGVTGSVRPGAAADLLVVDGDLRADRDALGRPVAVFVRGVRAA